MSKRKFSEKELWGDLAAPEVPVPNVIAYTTRYDAEIDRSDIDKRFCSTCSYMFRTFDRYLRRWKDKPDSVNVRRITELKAIVEEWMRPNENKDPLIWNVAHSGTSKWRRSALLLDWPKKASTINETMVHDDRIEYIECIRNISRLLAESANASAAQNWENLLDYLV